MFRLAKPYKAQAFTVVELLVVMAIITILSSVSYSVYGSCRESGRVVTCATQLRQVGAAVFMYANDYDGQYPSYVVDMYDKTCLQRQWGIPSITMAQLPLLSDVLTPYCLHDAFVCPSSKAIHDDDTDGGECEVSEAEMSVWPMTYMQRTTLSFMHANMDRLDRSSSIDILHCHGVFHGGRSVETRRSNVLFADDHVKLLNRGQLVLVSSLTWWPS